jgi:hypothetical protein
VPDLIRTLIWQRRDPPGAEYFGLWRDGDGWQLRGTVIVPLDSVPYRIRYGVICDAGWRTRAVHIALRTGAEERALHLTADGEGVWHRSGAPLPDLNGCLDIDLEITPATNTLPIRRMDLLPRVPAPVTAAWVRFPALRIEPLDQTYTRLSENQYRYESSGGFLAGLETDDLELVTSYADLWECSGRQDFPPTS